MEDRSLPSMLHKAPSLPTIVVQDESNGPGNEHIGDFHGIDTSIPTGGFEELMSLDKLEFSKRGSILLGGKRANMNRQSMLAGLSKTSEQIRVQLPSIPQATPQASPRPSPCPAPRSPPLSSIRSRAHSGRVLSADDMMLSRKVRLMYEHGNENAADWDELRDMNSEWRDSQAIDDNSVVGIPIGGSTLTVDNIRHRGNESLKSPSFTASRRESMIVKEPTEAAGGIEDWENIGGGEVDRYGFIVPKKAGSRGSLNNSGDAQESPGLRRVSTALKMVSEEPRQRRTIRRTGSNARSSRSANPSGTPRRRRSQRSLRPPGSMYSYQSTSSYSITQNPFRYAANRLPHNKDRRWMDEASDMLTLPPGLADIAEREDGGRAAMAMKKKEWEREEKWRKMAKIVTRGANSGGMIFEFDTKDAKLISRTWKGIPDRWRATAWYAFLSASAKVTKNSPTDEELIENFYELQEEGSADDVQIDVDIPRTINSHIMFRRRYRGGQRLLFRVLHAMSLYLPDTGYVQGMAALTATLLCYYDEEKAFVMLVRLWQLRGLERLYESGFEGLMEALKDFEENWLAEGDVAKKLEELNITSTAYGTRWYLTLFNYSIPFPAQLRVWDVFMLLGDASNSNSPTSSFSGDLDVLHATSAALIDATREILLDSDFENAMKVLTSWIPIKDEDLLMRVAKAEWKIRKKRANAA